MNPLPALNVSPVLVLNLQPRVPGAPTEMRAYQMTAYQTARFAEMVLAVMKNDHLGITAASSFVEKICGRLLTQKGLPEDAPGWAVRLRLTFPALTRAELRALPRMGCPKGRIDAILSVIEKRGGAQDGKQRAVLFRFNEEQAEFFTECLDVVTKATGCSRDNAWALMVPLTASLLVNGRNPDARPCPLEELDFERLCQLFPQLSPEEVEQLPEATWEDVLRWTYRKERG